MPAVRAEPRHLKARRDNARALIAERKLKLIDLPNGAYQVIGPGVNLKISDLIYLVENDLDSFTSQRS